MPAEREITIRDLMTHTSGLESGGVGSRAGARIAPRSTASNLQAYIPTLGALDNVAAGRRVSSGSFGWGGAFGTYFWVDRKESLVGLLMVQESVGQLRTDLENAVMQAIIE